MSVHEYRQMIAKSSGTAGPQLPEGWTYKDFDWNTSENEWNATIYFDEKGEPRHLAYYIWRCSRENFEKSLKEAIGEGYKLYDEMGSGGGHGDAHIAKVDP